MQHEGVKNAPQSRASSSKSDVPGHSLLQSPPSAHTVDSLFSDAQAAACKSLACLESRSDGAERVTLRRNNGAHEACIRQRRYGHTRSIQVLVRGAQAAYRSSCQLSRSRRATAEVHADPRSLRRVEWTDGRSPPERLYRARHDGAARGLQEAVLSLVPSNRRAWCLRTRFRRPLHLSPDGGNAVTLIRLARQPAAATQARVQETDSSPDPPDHCRARLESTRVPIMADMDPPVDDIFAGMKKKKKGAKKVVNIDEFDTDVPAPAAPSNDATSISGSGAAANPAAAATPADAGDASDGELDLSSIKKKKKKSVRIDSDPEDAADMEEANPKSRKVLDKLGNEVDDAPLDTQLSAEVTAVDASGMDEFADLKKKRKKASKKAFDLDAFEKELAEAEAAQEASGEPKGILKKPTPAGSDDEGEVDEDDEVPEGEDPFGGEGDHDDSRASKAEAAATAKAWLNEDRDYHYTEVRSPRFGRSRVNQLTFAPTGTAPRTILLPPVPVAPGPLRWLAQEEVHDSAPAAVP